ncbi:MAG TPA: type II toxin-antitoxin system RelE/ParE family toxin [Kofleriaceae bacterium]|jgi:plasmid stabilization system protein ParE|nr:type II toxin-antitoxin system RelE/ParE family toxin [Kofleriaceae bacterium]
MGQEPRPVVWAAGALEDLVAVLEDLAERDPGFERDLYEDVMAAAASLATLSERGRLVPELHDRRTREIFVREYRVMYEVHDERIAVVAFVFGRRDFAAWWHQRGRR